MYGFICHRIPVHHHDHVLHLFHSLPHCSRRWRDKWAQYVHPGVLTLDITSTQRVEGAFARVKRERGKTMLDVKVSLKNICKDWAVETFR